MYIQLCTESYWLYEDFCDVKIFQKSPSPLHRALSKNLQPPSAPVRGGVIYERPFTPSVAHVQVLAIVSWKWRRSCIWNRLLCVVDKATIRTHTAQARRSNYHHLRSPPWQWDRRSGQHGSDIYTFSMGLGQVFPAVDNRCQKSRESHDCLCCDRTQSQDDYCSLCWLR
jgi:hypothetical protein